MERKLKRSDWYTAASRPGSAEPAGVPETVVGQATLGISGEIRSDAIKEIHVDRVHVLDLNPTARHVV